MMKIFLHFLGLCIYLIATKLYAQDNAIAFDFYQGLIFLEIQIENEDTLLCLFDTGAEISAIDEQTSNRLKLPVVDSTKVIGTNTTIDVEVVSLTGIVLKNYRVHSINPTKRDLSHSLTPDNRKLDMILGFDFIKGSIIEIDFRNQKINIIKDSSLLNFDHFIPFSLDHNIPRFSGTANDKIVLDLRLDTGASLFETDDVYINVTTRDWEALQALDPSLKPESYLYATGINNEQIQLPVVRLDKIKIGTFQIDNPYIIVQPIRGYFALPNSVGFVSNNFLQKFDRIAIDYINNRIYYKNCSK